MNNHKTQDSYEPPPGDQKSGNGVVHLAANPQVALNVRLFWIILILTKNITTYVPHITTLLLDCFCFLGREYTTHQGAGRDFWSAKLQLLSSPSRRINPMNGRRFQKCAPEARKLFLPDASVITFLTLRMLKKYTVTNFCVYKLVAHQKTLKEIWPMYFMFPWKNNQL